MRLIISVFPKECVLQSLLWYHFKTLVLSLVFFIGDSEIMKQKHWWISSWRNYLIFVLLVILTYTRIFTVIRSFLSTGFVLCKWSIWPDCWGCLADPVKVLQSIFLSEFILLCMLLSHNFCRAILMRGKALLSDFFFLYLTTCQCHKWKWAEVWWCCHLYC